MINPNFYEGKDVYGNFYEAKDIYGNIMPLKPSRGSYDNSWKGSRRTRNPRG